ncbi:hypothetical protein BT67DRAFT_123886 [Trichocladium antarcticum]|uniref:Uncharacterized protein n=1 Tax=Trichocladium antarcticum TaxID=1450529 RepID=A0AAN6US75_9PEZI|nr:hypothetical protein BT67DRAFT_123886 [Trichocladium antarcticum]
MPAVTPHPSHCGPRGEQRKPAWRAAMLTAALILLVEDETLFAETAEDGEQLVSQSCRESDAQRGSRQKASKPSLGKASLHPPVCMSMSMSMPTAASERHFCPTSTRGPATRLKSSHGTQTGWAADCWPRHLRGASYDNLTVCQRNSQASRMAAVFLPLSPSMAQERDLTAGGIPRLRNAPLFKVEMGDLFFSACSAAGGVAEWSLGRHPQSRERFAAAKNQRAIPGCCRLRVRGRGKDRVRFRILDATAYLCVMCCMGAHHRPKLR